VKAAAMDSEHHHMGQWSRSVIALALAVALVDLVKHLLLISAGQAQPWGDSTVYWRMAGDVATGDWWLTKHPVAYRTPGYPWLLGIIRATCGDSALWVTVWVQHLCAWLTTLLTIGSTWRLSRSARATILAWAVCALSTARPLYANWILTESVATLLLMLTCWMLLLALECGCWKRFAFAGFVLGCGVLVRPSLLAVLPALLVVGYQLARRQRGTWFRQGLILLSAPLLLGLTLLPWCLRNHFVFDRFALCVFTGRELWTASFSPWPGAHLPYPEGAIADEIQDRLGEASIDWRHHWSVSRVLARTDWDDAEIDNAMERVARQAIADQPVTAAFCTLARCGTFWYCWEWPTELAQDPPDATTRRLFGDQFRWHSPVWQPRVIAGLEWTPERQRATSFVAVFLGWTGLLRMLFRYQTRPAAIFIGLILIATTLLTATLEIPLYRYRCGLEPLLIVAATVGWTARHQLKLEG